MGGFVEKLAGDGGAESEAAGTVPAGRGRRNGAACGGFLVVRCSAEGAIMRVNGGRSSLSGKSPSVSYHNLRSEITHGTEIYGFKRRVVKEFLQFAHNSSFVGIISC